MLDDTPIGHDRVDELMRGDIEHRVPCTDAFGHHSCVADSMQFGRIAFLDVDQVPLGVPMSTVDDGATTMNFTP